MKCQRCGKTGFVTIGAKRYCSHCGHVIAGAPAARMSDVSIQKRKTHHASASRLDQHKAGGHVLDLRTGAKKQPAAQAPSAIKEHKTNVKPAAPSFAEPAKPKSSVSTGGADKARLDRATGIAKHPLVRKFAGADKPEPAKPSLPPQVAAEVERMGKAAPRHAARAEKPAPSALQAALAAARPSRSLNPLGLAAAVFAIIAMGSFVYLQNAPKLAFRSAANHAGIDASLPSYLPTTLHQIGPVNVQPGAISINYSGSTAQDNLNITQRATSWDSRSLRDNYVSRQTDKFQSVQGQGLTIYFFNNNQATWVNHGIWYSIIGNTTLGRDQILKIAYGL